MSSASLIGRTLGGRFRIIGFIGEGAMASVYRAVQVQEPRDVAVKVMHPHLIGDPTFVGRFRREAKAASQIQHPNTVQILDFGVDDRVLYIAMELLGGQDLFETLVVERRLGERRAVRILVQICDALIAAHEKGIVHRDLKPENIMLLPPDPADPTVQRVKVLDFGIAKILERDAAPASDGGEPNSMANSVLTTVGMVVGTPAYMSPEQCRGEIIDARSDIYACGILLYQLVAGRLPFTGDNAMDLAVKHVRSEPPPIHAVIPTVNRELERVILTALGKWPAQRQASAIVLKEQLEAILPELTDGVGLVAEAAMPLSEPGVLRRALQEQLDGDSVTTLRTSPTAASEPDIAKTLTSEKALAPLDATVPAGPLHLLDEPATRPFHAPRPAAGAPAYAADLQPAAPPKRPIPEPEHTLASVMSSPSELGPAPARPAPIAAPTRAPAARSGWLLIPFALVIGIAVGVLAYFFAR
jgi:eukaryotic-like serine/threonine-protein kinase